MTNDNNIKRIIQLYFGKHFSRSGRVLFGRWLRAEGEASEKSDMLQAFWEHLPAEATAETREDWDARFIIMASWKVDCFGLVMLAIQAQSSSL